MNFERKKNNRQMPLRQYLMTLRNENEIFKKAFDDKTNKVRSIKDIMTDEFIEYAHQLGLSNRNLATILGCSAGTIGQYMSEYNLLKVDDAIWEDVNYTEFVKASKIMPNKDMVLNSLLHSEDNVFLVISDIQAGALVTADEFDKDPKETVEDQFSQILDGFFNILTTRRIYPKNVNIMLLGDLVDGWAIYPNQQTIPIREQLDVVATSTLNLIKAISQKVKPESINVYGVQGNHGRVSRYHAKSDNWDTICLDRIQYNINLLKQYDKDFANVNSFMTDKPTIRHKIGDFTYLLNHGDTLRSNSSSSLESKTKDWYTIYDGDVDAILLGHWHQFEWRSVDHIQVLINGTTYSSPYVKYQLVGREDLVQLVFIPSEYEAIGIVEKIYIN